MLVVLMQFINLCIPPCINTCSAIVLAQVATPQLGASAEVNLCLSIMGEIILLTLFLCFVALPFLSYFVLLWVVAIVSVPEPDTRSCLASLLIQT